MHTVSTCIYFKHLWNINQSWKFILFSMEMVLDYDWVVSFPTFVLVAFLKEFNSSST